MMPPGPVPRTWVRSTPLTRATYRTGGVANGRSGRVGGATIGALTGGADVEVTESAPTRPRRWRRLADAGAGPYPTSTSTFSTASAIPTVPSRFPAPTFSGSSLAVSIEIMGRPTSTVVPASASNAVTVPANGLGSSTTAFSVSTSAMGWFNVMTSPTATNHETSSASVNPSPRSGRRNCCVLIWRVIGPPHRECDRRRAGSDLRAWPAGMACRNRRPGVPALRGGRSNAH